MEKVSTGKIGRYEIIKVLGRGGMGEVILAQDEILGRRVAIKRPFKSAIAEGLARFQVEAKAATLQHPNIPAVYEMGVDDDLPFIAMEFVEGETLEKIIDSKREVDLITKLRIIEQVCSALGYAHGNGIIHRDIKPANIIVQPDGTAKIIDFGIAKLQDEDPNSGLTKASQLIGSLHYIAPERFYGGKVDGRADIFSAGVTLFKLLTGREPFTGGEATASFKIMNEAHTGLGAYLHDYPPALDEIVEKSLAKNPDDRYQTGEDFADALHEVMEELKRTRVAELFNDAERLATERRFAPALELLDEAVKLDPSNTQARKLRKFVREHQERIRRAERVRECLLKSDEALLSDNYDEALNQLKDAQGLDPASDEIKSKIQSVEERKRRFDNSARALVEAERVKARGDVVGALRVVSKALEQDPDNKKLLSLNAALSRQMEIEAQRGRLLELQEGATRALASRDFETADKLLGEAATIDAANLETDKLRRELAKAKELEQRRAALEEIEQRVHEFIRNDGYDQAADLLSRALERLPNEALLHRLKAEVSAAARKHESRQAVDSAISRANELFARSPFEALAAVQEALEALPGEERLVEYERSLRQQLDAHLSEQLRAQALLNARELMDGGKFDKAVDVLESFQLEHGQHPDVDALLTFARESLVRHQRSEFITRTLSQARTLVRDSRLDEAVHLLDTAQQQTGDTATRALLNEVREQKAVLARKMEALLKRVEMLRERGELDEAIRLLQEQLADTPGNTNIQQLVNSLTTERKQKQVIAGAIAAAEEAAHKKDFHAALESLQTVVTAYGESAQITNAIHDVERRRSDHAGESVSRSVETAQAELLKKDPQAALEALKAASQYVEFADAQKQAEWQRIAQAVKKALEKSGATTSVFDQQLSGIAQARPAKMGVWAVAGAVLVLVITAGIVLFLRPKPIPSSIEIQNITPGATVTVDGTSHTPDATGDVKVSVKHGVHRIVVSKDGFKTKDKSADIQGQYTMDGTLIPQGIRTGKMQFALPGDLPKVSVSANGKPYGDYGPNDDLDLPVGAYAVTFNAPGYDPLTVQNVIISDAQPTRVQVAMVKAATGTVTVRLAADLANVRMFANGKPQGEVRSNQKIVLREGTYTLHFESLGYKPMDIPGVNIGNGSDYAANVQLEKIKSAVPQGFLSASQPSILQGDSVTLSWQTQNVSAADITGIGSVASNGTKTVSPATTTTYSLRSNGNTLSQVTIQVSERPKPKVDRFEVSQNSIESGHSTTLTWQVENASAVQITQVGTVPPQGSAPLSPTSTTSYQLSVNGATLASLTVDVHAAPVTPPTSEPPSEHRQAEDPTPLIKQALNNYVAAFNSHDMRRLQSAWTGITPAQASAWSSVFKNSKSASISEECEWSTLNITDTSATVSCTENLQLEKGSKASVKRWRFSFANRNGTWVMTTFAQ